MRTNSFLSFSDWFRVVYRPTSIKNPLRTFTTKSQAFKQYASKARLRYLRSRREPSWQCPTSWDSWSPSWMLTKHLLERH